MEFNEQIKKLRKENNLTQEQFASKINVIRQAVSNWENNRNLPDIETLIRIAGIFHVSLDQLITGGEDMNKMTEKLIKDGNEGRTAKMNLISSVIGCFLMILGMACILIKANSVEYIDAQGILHENFYLLPVGFLLMIAGFIVIPATFGVYLFKRFRKNKAQKKRDG